MTDLEALNREVAERVMGDSTYRAQAIQRSYATDIAAAFEVVEKVCQRNQQPYFFLSFVEGEWTAEFKDSKDNLLACADRESLPEAICRAALQVVGAETE